MREARQHPRIPFRFAVELFGAADRQPEHCISSNISLGGMFADGMASFFKGEPVRVVLGADRSERLHLDARVARTNASGLACEFVGNSPASMEVLEALLTPTWDGENLLDGVMRFAPWQQDQELAGWMRLTSLVSDWQRLRQRPASLR
jgi:hypothetical protein